MKLDYNLVYILVLIFLSYGCNSKVEKAESSEQFDSNIQLKVINEWEIHSPEVIPYPRFAGVLRDTSLIVFDRSLNTINRFDRKGILINTLGGSGRGPGEFSVITHAAVNPIGEVAVADISNARFTIINLFEESMITEDLNGGWHTRLYWVSDQLVISNNPFKEGVTNPGDVFMRSYDPVSGEKDLIFQLELKWRDNISEEQISCTFCKHRFMDDLRFFTSPQDTSYRIYRVNPQTDETLLYTRSGVSPIKYTEQERKELQNQKRRAQQITGLNSEDDIPTHKPRFIDFFPDQTGRLWALLNPIEGQIPVFDLFSPDAEYIGSVQAPVQVETVQFIPDNYILFRYKFEDPDVWT